MSTTNVAVRGNVLVIDNDPDCGELILNVLGQAGYGVRIAQSRAAALLAIKQQLFDYVIVDVVMPGMSIQEFLENISATVAGRVIIISAIVDPRETAQRLNVKSWLRKPFDPDQLIAVMNKMPLNRKNPRN